MRKLHILGLIIVVAAILAGLAFAEEITLSTYYPAPFGVYKEMRAQRMAVGTNYLDSTAVTVADDNLIVEGNVGIGTASPTEMLHLRNQNSNAMLYCETDSNTSAAGIYVRNDLGQPLAMEVFGSAYGGTWAGLTSNRMAALVATTPSNFIIGTNNGGNLVFGTAPNGNTTSERMRITETGDVGIGTANPQTKPAGSGYLDAQDVWVRDANAGAGAWVSETAGGAAATPAFETIQAVSTNNQYAIAHGLGQRPTRVEAYYCRSTDPNCLSTNFLLDRNRWVGSSHGAQVAFDAVNIYISTGPSSVYLDPNVLDGGAGTEASGFYRIVAW